VYLRLRERLVAGTLVPGQKVSLRTTAAELGVSMQPVRDAVARLVAERALVVLPNRAVRVPLLTLAQFRELTAIRLVVEGYAAERAAMHRTPAQLASIRRHDAAFRRERSRPRPDAGRVIAHNQALHFTVYRAAALAELVPIIEGLWLRIGPVLNFDLRGDESAQRMGRSDRCHERLVDAIARGDGRGARRALASDIEGAARHIAARGVLPAGSVPPAEASP
jgi:DNA-binding GntR family transcriptional regulator